MATQGRNSWVYIGTAAIPKGTMLKMHTVAGQCDVATAVTDTPCGIALEDVTAGNVVPQHVGVGSNYGEVYKVIASTTIAIKAALVPTTAGEAVTITLSSTYASEWVWGTAVTAGGSGGTDIVEMCYHPNYGS